MSIEEKVLRHFDADAQRFDSIYEEAKGPFERFVDHIWRGVVRRRLVLTLEKTEPLQGKTVLDVGCGSGRFCVEFARRGAARILGVDFAPAMIDIAKDLTRRSGMQDRCEYRVGAFPEVVPEQGFDISTALGFFDYIAEPVPIVKAMREKTRSTMVLSFPKANEWRVPIRRVRFMMLSCPLFLYTKEKTEHVLRDAGVTDYDWIPLDRDYMVVARP